MPALQKKHKKSSVHNIKSVMNTRYGPSDRIRTCGILLPKQARYQTAPRPEGVEQLRSKPCVSQSEGNYRGDSPPVQALMP